MKPGHAGGHFLAIFAIIFLLGFGFVVYAVPGAVTSADSSSTTASAAATAQTGTVYYTLVSVSPTAKGSNASGYAGVSVSGQTLTLEWSVSKAPPEEQLQMVMLVTPTTGGATKSFTFTTVTAATTGNAGGSGTATLDAGHYNVGLSVVDPSTDARTPVLASNPATAQVAVPSSQPVQTTPTAVSNALSYSLVPLPVYLGGSAPANYSFKEGGALIVAYGDQLFVTTSFIGAPGTRFYNVLQTATQNSTIGVVTTTSIGGGVFKGNVTLSPGTYQVGLLIYAAGVTASPVAVSVPRSIQITLPGSTATTSTGTHTSSSSTSTASTSTRESTSSESHTTSTSTSSTPAEGVNQLQFVSVTGSAAPEGYLYGKGEGGYAATNGYVYFSLSFTGQVPNSRFAVVLAVNGTAKTIGNYTTNSDGGANLGVNTYLGAGRFVLGVSIADLSNFKAPATVLVSVPSVFVVQSHVTTSTTTSSTTTLSSTSVAHSTAATSTTTTSPAERPQGPVWTFKLVPAVVPATPLGYRFATSGTAVVTLDARYSLLNVVLGFQDGNPSTTFNAALMLNGTEVNLGTMTTNKGGAGELHSSIQVSPGQYSLGVVVFDVSDIPGFGATSPVLVLVSDPATQTAIITPPIGLEQSSTTTENSTVSQTVVTSTITTTVTTIKGGGDVEAQIQDAVDNLTIPATVQITPLQSTTDVHDSRFSLSVGQQVGNGLVIAISGENVTGPRVLLINMSKTAPLALYPALNVTLDGEQVTEAASALQVLQPVVGAPPYYVLVATSDSFQLLVSIPHFSLHLIQVAGQVVQRVASYLSLDAPLLAGSVLVITLAFAAAYAARKRYFAVI